jgi:chromosome condensin MukBEF ATPase and DNA-binding subunit MukB
MSNYDAKDMFQLQSELIEVKVDMAVSKAIDRVIDRIDSVRDELRDSVHKMRSDIHNIDKRLAAAETSLNNLQKITDQVRTRLMDYGMKAVWVIIGSGCLYAASLVINHFPK